MRREIVTTTTKMAEVSAKKYEKSRSSFIQFGKLLNCESWYLKFKVGFLGKIS